MGMLLPNVLRYILKRLFFHTVVKLTPHTSRYLHRSMADVGSMFLGEGSGLRLWGEMVGSCRGLSGRYPTISCFCGLALRVAM